MAIAALGLKSDEATLKAISQNIANVTTPGYKRQISVTPAFVQQFDQLGGLAVHSAFQSSAGIDPSAGVLRPSGEATDVAVEGDAYFELAGPAGPVYSRQGNLRVDVSGRLVGAQGLPVMGTGGEISLANLPFSIAGSGEVRQGGRVVGMIKLVGFTQSGGLASLGNGLYAQGNARIDEQGRHSTLRSGFIEGSNVNSPQEMVRLTETVRHFEALHKVVQGYDESLEQAIRKLGEF